MNPITNQHREDQLVTALEGGSNYWYFLDKPSIIAINEKSPRDGRPLSIRMWEAIQKGAVIPIFDVEDPNEKLGEISLESIERGEQTMLEKYPFHYSDIIGEDGDASTADVWFQLATLGEIVYG